MKLTEIKKENQHYFIDEQGRTQGQYKDWFGNGQLWEICHYKDDEPHGVRKSWHDNGQQSVICHFRDGKLHGELKFWSESGELYRHTFDIDGEEIVDFIENPELYPTTPEDKTYFALKYNIGDAQFIK